MTAQPKVELLYSGGCQGYRAAIDELAAALVEAGYEPRFEIILVRDTVDAERLRFFGSPTIRIDGEDIEEKAANMTRFGINVCRPYFWKESAADYPPRELIHDALRRKGYVP